MKRTWFILACVLAVGYPLAAGAVQYHLNPLGIIGPGSGGMTQSYAYGLNDAGTVVGKSTAVPTAITLAATWNPKQALPSLVNCIFSEGNAVNAAGNVAGSSSIGSAYRATLWQGNSVQNLGILGTYGSQIAQSWAYDINDSGVVVGKSSSPATSGYRAFSYDGTTMRDLGDLSGGADNSTAVAINSSGTIVGYSASSSGSSQAFVYKNETMTGLNYLQVTSAGFAQSWAYDINDLGLIVGGQDFVPVIWKDGMPIALGNFSGYQPFMPAAVSINDRGQVVGNGAGPASTDPFILNNGNNLILLAGLLDASAAGWSGFKVTGINESGVISGYGFNPSGITEAFTLTPNNLEEDADGDGSPYYLDCNDNDPNVHPGAVDDCSGDGIDNNCDWYIDRSNCTYTIAASAGSNGSITPSGDVAVAWGAAQRFSIAPAVGYAVDTVTVDGRSVGAAVMYTFTNVTANHSISATFKRQAFTITAIGYDGGSITPSGTVSLYYGDSQSYAIVPFPGCDILAVYVDNVNQGPIASYTFQNVTSSHSIKAEFLPRRRYSVKWLGVLGAPYTGMVTSHAYGINDLGQVLGNSSTSVAGVQHSFLWNGGVMTDLGGLYSGTYDSMPAAINNLGQVVGRDISKNAGNIYNYEAFLWDDGQMTGLGDLRAFPYSSEASGINSVGQIIGTCSTSTACLWQSGTIQNIGAPAGKTRSYGNDINDLGQVVGTGYSVTYPSYDNMAFLWQDGVFTPLGDLPGGTVWSVATAINNSGQITGHSSGLNGWYRGYLWENGTMTALGIPATTTISYTESLPYDLNDSGQVIGSARSSNRESPFIWEATNGMFELSKMTVNLASGSFLSTVSAINHQGQIAGDGYNLPLARHEAFILEPDKDFDGYFMDTDCDDNNAAINPGAAEICGDLIDNNCNGQVDEGCACVITPSAGAGGTINPGTPVTVPYLGSRTFTITPNANYKIADVKVDNVSVGAVSSYTFSNVTASHTIAATFAPYTVVTVVQPNGGEVLATGSTYAIKWGGPATAVKFNLSYSLNNGSGFTTIANGVTGYSYNWSVPVSTANQTQCLIKVIGLDARGKTVGTDTSDRVFTIEVVRVTSPNGGESWQVGNTYPITWISNKTTKTVNKVTLSYATDGGSKWTKIIDLTTNALTYSWKIPAGINSAQCRVKVNLFNGGTNLGLDISDANFSITP